MSSEVRLDNSAGLTASCSSARNEEMKERAGGGFFRDASTKTNQPAGLDRQHFKLLLRISRAIK